MEKFTLQGKTLEDIKIFVEKYGGIKVLVKTVDRQIIGIMEHLDDNKLLVNPLVDGKQGVIGAAVCGAFSNPSERIELNSIESIFVVNDFDELESLRGL